MRRRFMMGQVYFSIDNYLTIEALEDNLTVKFPRAIEYGIDGKGWSILPKNTDTPPINASQTISFRANLIPYNLAGIGTFTISKKCNLKGNCMSMLFGDNAANNYSLNGIDYAFYRLFYDCTNIVNVSSNFLPATTLAYNCYGVMFNGCTSLTTAPELPATTLAYNCYSGMFNGCTSLTTAPELPATTLVYGCYNIMFNGCEKLNYIKALFTTTPSSTYTSNWVYGVAFTGTFVKNKNATWNVTGENGIPSRWTVVNDVEITFTIDGTEYQAEEEMTWHEWVNSKYNTAGYYEQFYSVYDGELSGLGLTNNKTHFVASIPNIVSLVSPYAFIIADYDYVMLNISIYQ